MEDVARQANLARATLYRHFDGKDALVGAIILAESERFFMALDDAIAGTTGDEERLVEGFAFGLEYVRRHPLLDKLRRTEPELLLAYLLGDGKLVGAATESVAARIGDREVAELVVRLVLSLALCPESALGADDRDGARRFARRRLAPILRDPPVLRPGSNDAGRRPTDRSAH
jgi:AcrR family transcriptional regulator